MMTCWLFHKWSKWHRLEAGPVVTFDLELNKSAETGTFLIQQRECGRCGKQELNVQKVDFNA